MSFTLLRSVLAVVAILISLWVLESARSGLQIATLDIGDTPVARYAQPEADGPVIVIAHGFAGSEQMMQGYALPLARAGYQLYAFEFLGHGQHRLPMSGDVNAIEGTTRLLMDQTHAVIDALGQTRDTIGLLGHSMATDILVRVTEERSDIGPVVLISAFSQRITEHSPANLLLITGAWEAGLRDFALEAVQMVSAHASEGETVANQTATRRAVAAPFSEHVSVLHSRTGRAEAVAWFDDAYARQSQITIAPTGWAILGLLTGLVLIFPLIVRRLPDRLPPPATFTRTQMAILCAVPALLSPPVAVWLDTGFLPVLVADYLAIHLAIFGVLQLALLRYWRINAGRFDARAFLLVIGFCIIFGAALDRYAANFWPTPERFWIITALTFGAVPYMLADARIAQNTSYLGRLLLRSSFLASLGLAVLLDFEALFFLLMIAPVLVLFFAVFATIGRSASLRSGPLAVGLALGLMLAWALGVSFPLFQA